MSDFYKPFEDRTPDSQYRDRLKFILDNGVMAEKTFQGVGALTCLGTLPAMQFDLSNGVPVIADRSIKGFWRKPVAEIIAFIHGKHTVDDLIASGCDYWNEYRGRGAEFGMEPDDLGPGSYGAAFHDFPRPDGTTFNQYEKLVWQIQKYPHARTHFITPWIPYYTASGNDRKVIVAPCHGWQLFRVLQGKLHLVMWQRSADFPIGVPSNMAQYACVLLMMARATGLAPGTFVHQFGDAHIYEDQIDHVRELVLREPLRLPTLRLRTNEKDFFSMKADDFELEDYHPHKAMPGIPYRS
jgi:thymidylate synthase